MLASGAEAQSRVGVGATVPELVSASAPQLQAVGEAGLRVVPEAGADEAGQGRALLDFTYWQVVPLTVRHDAPVPAAAGRGAARREGGGGAAPVAEAGAVELPWAGSASETIPADGVLPVPPPDGTLVITRVVASNS